MSLLASSSPVTDFSSLQLLLLSVCRPNDPADWGVPSWKIGPDLRSGTPICTTVSGSSDDSSSGGKGGGAKGDDDDSCSAGRKLSQLGRKLSMRG